jgi:hypothetical protein
LDIVFPSPKLARNILGSNEALTLFLTKAPFIFFSQGAALSPDEGRARQGDYSDSNAQMKVGNRTSGKIVPAPYKALGLPFLLAVMSRHKRVADRAPIIG